MHKNISINVDSFSSGQMSSKIWLAEYLETCFGQIKQNIWILGGWYGISALVLLTRNILWIESCRSFDIDPSCQPIADTLLNNWVWQKWKFKAFTADCNTLDYATNVYGPTPSLVINTSCEHFISDDWFHRIPNGVKIALQSNNMAHDDHHSNITSQQEMYEKYPLSNTLFTGEKQFKYPEWGFTRYMLIGIK
jgi:hypothetical protein